MIVDDEPLAIKVIASHLEKVSDMEIVATCSNALQAYETIQKQPVELIFLDIQMPELTGIEFIKSLEHTPKIIFTTAYRDYALEGFELDVVDYLLKPVSLPRLLRALDKYRRLRPSGIVSAPENDASSPAYLSVRSNRQTVRISIPDILYIESLSDYVKIHTQNQVVICKERISHLAGRLKPDGFLRVHRSFLVATARITSFTADEVHIGDTALPVSRSYKNAVRQYMESAT